MPKFAVTVVKTVWEEVQLEIEAADEEMAETYAIERARNDENLECRWEETLDYDAVKTELIEPPKQAAE
jgi:hypothetical protein